MKRELRDELGVPGHVIAFEPMSRKEAKEELNRIMAEWEEKGWKKPDDVPESKQKQRFRDILIALGLEVKF